MLTDRLAPANVEAEESVLGALLLDPTAVLRVAAKLQPEDFSRPAHAKIYRAITALYERQEPIDTMTVQWELERRGQLAEVGGEAYLTELITRTPTSAHVDHYAGMVENEALRRRLIATADGIAELAYTRRQCTSQELIDQAQELLFRVSERQGRRDLVPIVRLVEDFHERLEQSREQRHVPRGVQTGFRKLDVALGGLHGSDLVIIAGRPGTGKTSWLLTVATHAATQGHTVAVFSLEMAGEQLLLRLISGRTHIPVSELRNGRFGSESDFDLVLRNIAELAEMPLYIDDTAGLTPFELRTKVRQLHDRERVDLVCIDYLQLMHGGRSFENRVQEISLISRSLKALARELNVPVIAASQLSRAIEHRKSKAPLLSDLRDSGSIEQDADIVIFLDRDTEPNASTEQDDSQLCQVHIAKHRHGKTCTVPLVFVGKETLFEDVPAAPPPEKVPF